jgi:hypothetical protein
VPWLKSVIETIGYSITMSETDPNLMMARHDKRPNITVALRKQLSLITMQSVWTLKKPGWSQKTEFLTALNKANTINWLCSCHTSENLEDLFVSYAMYLSERTSSRDVIGVVEAFLVGVEAVIDKSGIIKFG